MPGERDAIQSLLGEIVRDRALRLQIEREPEAVLAERELSVADRDKLLSVGVPRLIAYHEMVNNRLVRTVRTFIGPAASQLGDERLRADVQRWLCERGSMTPYIRDVPRAFLDWVRPQWEADERLPPWLAELANHHVLIRDIRNDPRAVEPANDNKLELELGVACNATTRVLRYRWAVHRVKTKPEPEDATPAELEAGHAVIGLRAPDGRPRFIDLEPRSSVMLERLLAGKTLREALFGACEAMGEALDDEILTVTALTLADLSDRHVLLGAAAPA